MQINIVNKYKHQAEPAKDVYIGRGSALGNPWPITSSEDRDTVCDRYETYLRCEYTHNRAMKEQLNTIHRIGLEQGEVNLVCFCADKRCHGESIKRLIEDAINGELE